MRLYILDFANTTATQISEALLYLKNSVKHGLTTLEDSACMIAILWHVVSERVGVRSSLGDLAGAAPLSLSPLLLNSQHLQ